MSKSSLPSRQVPIAKARARLAAIVGDVERGARLELTRRGKPVAVLLSAQEYARLGRDTTPFETAFAEYHKAVGLESLGIGPGIFDGLRDRSPGREAPA